MTDRELLELAAEAANLKFVWDYDENFQGPCIVDKEGFPSAWNPLEDSALAFDLAAELEMEICFGNDDVSVLVYYAGGYKRTTIHEDVHPAMGRQSAARRAIVRAASACF